MSKLRSLHLIFMFLILALGSLYTIMYQNVSATGDEIISNTIEVNDLTADALVLSNYDYFGQSIANIGDLNGDGVLDIAVGASGDDAGGANRGAIHVMLMNSDGSVSNTIEINDLTANGPVLSGFDFFGSSIANIGDLNGDGVLDIAVGGANKGTIHVMLMNSNGSVSSTIKINSNTANGPVLSNSDFFGSSIANIGDLNGDGVLDIAVGASGDDAGGTDKGTIHVMLMNSNGSVSNTIEINDLTANGPVLSNSDSFGQSIANIGDLNGDGVLDIAVGASGDDTGGTSRGAIHVMLMNSNGSVSSTIKINNNTANGPVLSDNDFFGQSIANIGDLNNDGVLDIAVGATDDNTGSTDKSTIHVMLMNSNGSVSNTIEINDLTANGPVLSDNDYFGQSIANIGDLNNDGVLDIVVGATGDNAGGTRRGAIHVMLMNSDGSVSNTIEINDFTTNGPVLSNFDFFGSSIANIGDLNNDDISYIAVGATGGNSRGAIHVMLMNNDGIVSNTIEINDLTANGPVLSDNDYFGQSIANIGDLNNDGTLDIAVGAPGDDTGGSNKGAIHVMLMNSNGSVSNTIEINDLTANGPVLSNFDSFGRSIANIGDLNGDDILDIAVGAPGDDTGGNSRGAIHVMLMNSDGSVSSTIKINNNTANGPVLSNFDFFGQSIANIGDLNNDGTLDIAVGAIGDGPGGTNKGAIHVMLMNSNGSVSSTIKINNNITNGPVLSDNDFFGQSIANIGDLNNNGVLDIAVGASGDDTGGTSRGAIHVMLMNSNGSVSNTIEINDLTANGPVLYNYDYFGRSIANIGDLNNDGVLDITVGASDDDAGGTDRGAIHVLFMNSVNTTLPTITNITSNAITSGVLKVGDTISFTLTLTSAENGATINGTYNSVPLSWNSINNGTTYTATYTISEGDADQTTPLQITGVTITDSTGSTSLPFNGTDILDTIDANSPQFSSAQTLSISQIAITLDQSVTDSTATPNDFTLGGVTGGSINSIVSVLNDIITLDITGTTISDSDDVTISYARTSGSIDDVSGNSLLDFAKDVANNLDTTPPMITLIGDNPQTIEQGAGYTELNATTNDGSPVTINSANFTDAVGNYTIYYDSTDTAGNTAIQVSRTVNVVTPTLPTFSSAVLNEGTGIFTITFSEIINASAINSAGFSIRDNNTSTGAITLSNLELTTTANGATISFNMTMANRQSVIAFNVSVLDIGAGAVQDINGNAITLSANNTITTTSDSIPPVISLIGDNPQTIELGDGYTELNATTNDGSTITINSANFTDAVGNYTIYYDSTDTAGNNAIQVNRTVNVVDTTLPTLSSAVLNEGTGTFTITFSETINASSINSAGFSIRDNNNNTSTGAITLSNLELTTTANGATISFNMTMANRQSVIAFNVSVLDIGAGAVQDINGNAITLSANNTITTTSDSIPPVISLIGDNPQTIELGDGYTELNATTNDGSTITINSANFTDAVGTYYIYYDSTDTAGNNAIQVNRTVIVSDTTPPTFSSAALNEGTGIFTITFSETINASAINSAGFSIRDNNNNTSTGAITLSNLELTTTANGATISFNMTMANRQSVIAFNVSVLDIGAGAVQDINGNAITLSANNTITTTLDSIPPVISLIGDNPQTIEQGAGYTELNATTNDGSPVTINSAEFMDAVDTYYIYYDSVDISGNVATQVIRTVNVTDTIPPAFSSAVLNVETGVITIQFSETINVSTINPIGLSIRDNNSGAVTLSVSELITTANGRTISFNMSQTKLASVTAFTMSVLDIDAAAVSDVSGNKIIVSTDNPIRVTTLPHSHTPCHLPGSGDWIITTSCMLSTNYVTLENVIVRNNSVLIILDEITLDIDFLNNNLTIESGSGVLIESGGTIT